MSSTEHADDQGEIDTNSIAYRLAMIIGTESVASFSRRTGIGQALIRKYLSGSLPHANNLVILADAGSCTVDWLAAGRLPRFRAELFGFGESTENNNTATVSEEQWLLKHYREVSEDEKLAIRRLVEAIISPGGVAWYKVGEAISRVANIFPKKATSPTLKTTPIKK